MEGASIFESDLSLVATMIGFGLFTIIWWPEFYYTKTRYLAECIVQQTWRPSVPQITIRLRDDPQRGNTPKKTATGGIFYGSLIIWTLHVCLFCCLAYVSLWAANLTALLFVSSWSLAQHTQAALRKPQGQKWQYFCDRFYLGFIDPILGWFVASSDDFLDWLIFDRMDGRRTTSDYF